MLILISPFFDEKGSRPDGLFQETLFSPARACFKANLRRCECMAQPCSFADGQAVNKSLQGMVAKGGGRRLDPVGYFAKLFMRQLARMWLAWLIRRSRSSAWLLVTACSSLAKACWK